MGLVELMLREAVAAARAWARCGLLLRIGVMIGLIIPVLAADGGRAAPATPTAVGRGPVAIAAREFVYEPKQITVKAGEVTFSLKNTGIVEHDFVLENAARKQVAQAMPFAPGKSVQVKATLAPGLYIVYCTIPGHREAGMTGTVTAVP